MLSRLYQIQHRQVICSVHKLALKLCPFEKLMRFMLKDLKERGYTRAVVGVEPEEKLNREIYRRWGFTEHICTGNETYPDGTVIDVEFYGRQL